MCNNGKTFVNYLTPGPGGTAASAPYQLGLTHYTCGNKKMCVNSAEGFPVASALDVQIIGGPTLIPNSGQYCCDVRVICVVTYQQVWGCNCCPNTCLQTEKVVATVCVPCGETLPTVGDSGVTANAANVQCGCSTTNQIDLTVAFALETTTEAEAGEEGNG
jgi:hypothetical protein